MAKKSYYSFKKFEREKVRNKKKQEKLDRKQEAKDRKASLMEGGEEIDPDIADIIPGPQPVEEPEE
ncbi:MAG: hypothetical protein KJN62_01365 [Deltaproteobacteria bacterium]|nr:hypothetical protein [Deltaproteobacteria bacterium]